MMMKESKSANTISNNTWTTRQTRRLTRFQCAYSKRRKKPELWKRAPVEKNEMRESTLDSLHWDATRTFLARAHAGTRYPYYYLVLHLRVSASFRCYFAFESLLPFFGSGMIRAHARLSWPPPSRTLPASAVIMDRSRKSEFNFPSWPDTDI